VGGKDDMTTYIAEEVVDALKGYRDSIDRHLKARLDDEERQIGRMMVRGEEAFARDSAAEARGFSIAHNCAMAVPPEQFWCQWRGGKTK